MSKVTATAEQYNEAWLAECDRSYPEIDLLTKSLGYDLDRSWMQDIARVLACPVKVNPPCWQHGRVIYGVLRRYLDSAHAGTSSANPVRCLDIGTAKGYSAIVAARALLDAGRVGRVTSIDVIDPDARARRNTVAEVRGLLTLHDTVSFWPEEVKLVDFVLGKGENWFVMNRKRIHFAFVDGKHAYDSVKKELVGLSGCQDVGDIIICDDLQVPGVRRAVDELMGYDKTVVTALENRVYSVLVKR